mgnify:CR=1 FL=1
MTTNVISLVSIGAHPTSGRPRRAEQDARAVELGLQMAGDKLQVLHAGTFAAVFLGAMRLVNQMMGDEQTATAQMIYMALASAPAQAFTTFVAQDVQGWAKIIKASGAS